MGSLTLINESTASFLSLTTILQYQKKLVPQFWIKGPTNCVKDQIATDNKKIAFTTAEWENSFN